MRYEYNDGSCSAGREPRLYLAKGDKIARFNGRDIEGFCVIAKSRYEKNGKWSNTTYELEMVPGVRALYFLSPMHGVWGENLESWGEVAESLGLSVDTCKEIIGREYKKTAERLDKIEEFSLSVEKENITSETVIISFGSPTNRAIREGYWEEPKTGYTSEGKEVKISPGEEGGWYKPVVLIPKEAKIIASSHSPGMHGGYWKVEVIVPISN
ncbi:MAG: hypothetical protein PHI45_02805 [Candidatus Pacebacteria bacterium]|jgi:hypothetical protein|nr:hypothetical protein [Candidatus Paceibacterota bacterium]MDD5752987.1 hypothetical protein [Candidatus Paceibacterota bacterium]